MVDKQMKKTTKTERRKVANLLAGDGLAPYPAWVCAECGRKHNPKKEMRSPWATWHPGVCGVCGKQASVTEPRDYNYPNFPGHEKPW